MHRLPSLAVIVSDMQLASLMAIVRASAAPFAASTSATEAAPSLAPAAGTSVTATATAADDADDLLDGAAVDTEAADAELAVALVPEPDSDEGAAEDETPASGSAGPLAPVQRVLLTMQVDVASATVTIARERYGGCSGGAPLLIDGPRG